jgi:hypothetical protein
VAQPEVPEPAAPEGGHADGPLVDGPDYGCGMCRSIKTLRSTEHPASEEEIRAAALQFVRKISGYRVPSKANSETFEHAVDEIADSSTRLLDSLVVRPTRSA